MSTLLLVCLLPGRFFFFSTTFLATIHRLCSYDPQGALLFSPEVSVKQIIFQAMNKLKLSLTPNLLTAVRHDAK